MDSKVIPFAAALFLLANVSPCGIASATTYYVNQSHPKAKETNPGTREDLPFKSISAGVERAHAGDTVLIFSGTYREQISFPRSGESRKRPITVRAAPGASVQIKGSDLVTSWVPHSPGIWKRAGWVVNSQQVFSDGKPLQQIGDNCPFSRRKWGETFVLPAVGKGVSDMKPGSFYYDASGKTLYVRLADGSDPNRHEVEASVREFVVFARASFIELHGLHFLHSNVSAIPELMGIVNIIGNSWEVSNCSFTYGDFTGLAIGGQGHRIRNSICSHNGSVGISVSGSDENHRWGIYPGRPPQDILLEGNETDFNNYRGFHPDFHSGGIKAATSCNGVTVSGHKARSNVGPGIWFDVGCKNITITRSHVEGNRRGIEYEISEKGVISYNLVADNRDQGIYVSASDEVSVLNNTVVGNGFGIVLHGMPRAERLSLRNNTVRNNIVSESRGADLVLYDNPQHAGGNSSDYNLFHPGGQRKAKFSWTRDPGYGVNFTDLSSFGRSTGQESHSLIGDPLWRDRSTGDYSLRPGSPAIGAGTGEGRRIGNGDAGGESWPTGRDGQRNRQVDIGAFRVTNDAHTQGGEGKNPR